MAFDQFQIAKLRQYDASHVATSMFPPEILLHIFKSAVEEESSSNRIPFRIASVCSHWHQVVYGAPELWTSLSLRIKHTDQFSPAMNMLVLYLQNSGNRLIDLALQFSERVRIQVEGRTDLLHPIVDDLIRNNAAKFRSLALEKLPSTFAKTWCVELSRFIKLEHLYLFDVESTNGHAVRIPSTSSLTRVDLLNVNVVFSLAPNNIQALEFTNVPIDFCVVMLFECPQLISYSMGYPAASRSPLGSFRLPASGITHYNLSTLEWNFNGDAWNDELFRHLNAPTLNNFTWYQDGVDFFDENRWVVGLGAESGFCQRLPQSLTYLAIESVFYDSNLLSIIPRHLDLEEISLECENWDTLIHCANYLVPHSGGSQVSIPFPRLEEIGVIVPEDIDRQDFLNLVAIISHRLVPGRTLRIIFRGSRIEDSRRDTLPPAFTRLFTHNILRVVHDGGEI